VQGHRECRPRQQRPAHDAPLAVLLAGHVCLDCNRARALAQQLLRRLLRLAAIHVHDCMYMRMLMRMTRGDGVGCVAME
jgi:hypothetical protein